MFILSNRQSLMLLRTSPLLYLKNNHLNFQEKFLSILLYLRT